MASSTPLLFLRPMALPRPSTIHRFLGIARASTTTTTTTPPIRRVDPRPAKPTQSAAPAKPLPYRVTLTASYQYPVYTMAKRGGNMKLTKVQRIEGDVTALRNDLREALGVDEKEVTINQLTRHVIVKGHKKREIVDFFKERQL